MNNNSETSGREDDDTSLTSGKPTIAPSLDRRCGTCKRWTPHAKRDDMFDRHYGDCNLPYPKIAACFGGLDRYCPSSTAGDDCPKWIGGGRHGDLK